MKNENELGDRAEDSAPGYPLQSSSEDLGRISATIPVAKERPILFSGPMVRSILEGTKTQTRRIVKGSPVFITSFVQGILGGEKVPTGEFGLHFERDCVINKHVRCPYGKPGDRLWVRETWCYGEWSHDGDPFIEYSAGGDMRLVPIAAIPEDQAAKAWDVWAELGSGGEGRWRPSIHMPRWACRIELEVVSVRVEHLWDITEDDARAEGVETLGFYPGYNVSSVGKFEGLWNSINGLESWEANPWVWVVEFRVAPAIAIGAARAKRSGPTKEAARPRAVAKRSGAKPGASSAARKLMRK